MRILAIETSCDDTGVAILEATGSCRPKLLANLVSSQTAIHAPWGGVVPILAKREHQKNLVPVLRQVLSEVKLLDSHPEPALAGSGSCPNVRKKIADKPRTTTNCCMPGKLQDSSGLRPQNNTLISILNREPELLKRLLPFLKQCQKPDIDLIAVTNGPGLEPALWVGVNFARALGCFWNLPITSINHIEGHIAASFFGFQTKKTGGIPNFPACAEASADVKALTDRSTDKQFSQLRPSSTEAGLISKKSLPAIILVASGGHTQLILMRDFGQYNIIGETRDDAAGEAFDKAAKMLNLGYPGGPIVSKLAEQWSISNSKSQTNSKLQTTNYKLQIAFPRPMINSSDYDFSFSGLKTAALYLIKTLNRKQLKELTPAICAEFQQAVIDVLITKTIRAAREFNAQSIMLAGGVAANDTLREILKLKTRSLKLNFFVPPKVCCTDNAAMIAWAAYQKIVSNPKPLTKNWQSLKAEANLSLDLSSLGK